VKFPVKLNASGWPRWICLLFPSAVDARQLIDDTPNAEQFTRAMRDLRFGVVFKTTAVRRHAATHDALASLSFDAPPVVLDVGSSDGSTSLELIKRIRFETYYVTDLHLELRYTRVGGRTLFYDDNDACILVVGNRLIVYPDLGGALPPFGWIARKTHRDLPADPTIDGQVLLVTPALAVRNNDDENVVVTRYDVLRPWVGTPADLIIAGNILNRGYFDDHALTTAARNLLDALNPGGRLAIIDNRGKSERSTIFREVDGELRVEVEIDGGSEVAGLVARAHFGGR
jgi:hypothetical protein